MVPFVIAPGQEGLLSEMLGKGEALPGGCAWTGASVDKSVVVASYACAGARVELELCHSSDSAGAAARTERFAVRPRGAPLPEGLAGALAARIRAREAAFKWIAPAEGVPSGPPPPPPEQRGRAYRGLAVILAVAATSALLMRWAHRRLARFRASAAPLSPRAAIAAPALAVAISIGLAAAVHGALRAAGEAVALSLERDSIGRILACAAIFIVCVLLAAGAHALVARLPGRLPSWGRIGAGAAVYVAAAYPTSLTQSDLPMFGDVTPGRPRAAIVDPRPARQPITYRTGALGFREPDWSFDRPDSARRIVLIGDSFVFGTGVPLEDTLSSALSAELDARLPGRRIEVLNLGIPGDNIASHVDVAAASGRLSPDIMVLCLTLPNDLSRWDLQVARRDSGRPSAFSAARFVVGDAAGIAWDLARLERASTPEGLAHLDREMTRLTALRAASGRRPELVFFSFHGLDAASRARLEAVPGARIVPDAEPRDSDFIPGDGHPTGEGNRRFARGIADVIAPLVPPP